MGQARHIPVLLVRLGSAGSGSGDLVSTLLAPACSATTSAASSASWTSALERHGDHVGSSALLVFGGVLPLVVAAAAAIVTVFLLLVQGYGCSYEISACVIIGGGVIAGDGNHIIQCQVVCVNQAGKLVPQQPSPLQATNEGVHSCAVIYVLALVSGCQPSGDEASRCFTLLLDTCLQVACGGRSLVGALK